MTVELKPRIMVFGVGGAGGNAVNNMIESGLQGVDFVVANTDAQALVHSKADQKIQLGASTTEGLGAGAQPSIGSAAAEESLTEIGAQLEGAHMAFIAAGMGGGTGTGAAPVIARAAKENGVLTVGVVTKPFEFEGKRRMQIADSGIEELRHHVDTLIIIPNQNLFRIANANTTFADAFNLADEVLLDGVRGITDLMVMPGLINLDFADVRTVMSEMGAAMMGTGEAGGEQRALKAAQSAIANPLLDDISMKGAKGVLINITGGYDMTLYEVDEAANEVRREVDPDAQIILGSTFDSTLDGKIRVSVVATGILASAYAGTDKAPAPVVPEAEPEAAAIDDVPPQAATIITRGRGADLEEDTALEDEDADDVSVTSDTLLAGQEGDADAETAILSEPQAESMATEEEPPQVERPVINARPVAAAEEDYAYEEHEPAFHVQADDAGEDAPQPESSDAAEESKSGGFSGLFGWRRQPADQPSEPAVPSLDADAYEDDELEIPAFLRRSATN